MGTGARYCVIVSCIVLSSSLYSQVVREVRLPIEEGRVSLLALSRTLLDEYGYDGDHLRFRDVSVDVSGGKGTLLLKGISKTLLDTVRFEKVEEGKTLVVRIDSARARVVRHRLKQRFGRVLSTLARRDVLARSYVLDLPPDLGKTETFVLCVHGVDSSGRRFDDLRRFLEEGPDGIASGTFTYANDEAIDRIAKELSLRLKGQQQLFPERRIILLGHSMGALVCRATLETPELDPCNVTTLIMMGAPHLGSRLSRLRPGVDLLQMLEDHGDDPRFLAPFLDGLGEAGWDLWPDSPFLTQLNARPRNAKVQYYNLLGSKGLLSPEKMNEWRSRIMNKIDSREKGRIYAPKVQIWLEDLGEVIDGEGDGAVSLRRGRLEGAEEVVVPRSHNGMLREAAPGEPQPAFVQVKKWIQEARGGS